MSTACTTASRPMVLPVEVRRRIVAGMRWTVWLAVLGAPFSVVTSTLLARTGPEALGTFGLLTVYIGVVTAFLYFGGDAVAIQFLPKLSPQDRRPFLLSYLAVISLWVLPWLAAAALGPQHLRWLLGAGGSASFHALILWLSPIYILYCVVAACFKGLLHIPAAQALARGVPIAFCILYALLFAAWRPWVLARYTELIWGLYLGLVGLSTALGVFLLRRSGLATAPDRLRFFLPAGFWRYALSTQALGMLTFFILRLDYLLVLNFGGLPILGRYVALYTVAAAILVLTNLFRDTLLPSLTNLIASGNLKAASEVSTIHTRIVFLANTAATCGLILLALPLTALLGPRYSDLSALMVLMILLVGSSSPGLLAVALLSSVGKQQRAVWLGLGQIALDLGLFLLLWPRYGLLGAVLAYGAAVLLSNVTMWMVARFSVPFRVSGTRDYACFLAICCATAALEIRFSPLGAPIAVLVWLTAVGAFLVAARYRFAECLAIMEYFLPEAGAPRWIRRWAQIH
jgi:O-antigen/teichoic acid export membrane protein